MPHDTEREGLREDIARIVWTAGGGIDDAWDRMKARKVEVRTYADEKVAEAWATADAILARFWVGPKLSRARAAGIPVEEVGGERD